MLSSLPAAVLGSSELWRYSQNYVSLLSSGEILLVSVQPDTGFPCVTKTENTVKEGIKLPGIELCRSCVSKQCERLTEAL